MMRESSDFLQKELASVKVEPAHEQAIREVCEKFVGNWFDIRTELEEMAELGQPDCSPAIRARVDRIHRWLGEELPALHQLVTDLSAAAERDPLCGSAYILVAESATNVLGAYAEVADARERYLEACARQSRHG
jgi:hypothetical protein